MNQLETANLKCVNCGASHAWKHERNTLTCGICHRAYPVKNGVAIMLDAKSLAKFKHQDAQKKFEHQWEIWGADKVVYGKTSEEFQQRWMEEFKNPNLSKGWFKGKKALDAGCGHGIMVEVFDRLGAKASGMDLGSGIFSAQRRLKGKEVQLVQGDILAPPFAPGNV